MCASSGRLQNIVLPMTWKEMRLNESPFRGYEEVNVYDFVQSHTKLVLLVDFYQIQGKSTGER